MAIGTTVLTAAAALAETPALPTTTTLGDTMSNIGTVVSGLVVLRCRVRLRQAGA